MTSYQVNFASHHTRDRHVGFLSIQCSAILENTTKCAITLISSCHNTKLQLSDKYNSTHSVEILNPVKKLFQRNGMFCCFSLYRAVRKGNQGS